MWYSFETVGTQVTIIFELLDNRTGVIAYLWNRNPFTEQSMTNLGGRKFSITRSGQTPGSVIEVACKFAFAGGLAVTRYITYTVGDHCSTVNAETLNDASGKVVIYPNPVKDNFTVIFPYALNDAGQLRIYDVSGNLVQQDRIHEQVSQISTSDLKAGLYLVQISNGNTHYIQKLFIVR